MQVYYQSRNHDHFKDVISLPGLAMKDLFSNIDTFFTLLKTKVSDIHDIVKRGMVGGPSVVFDRHQKMDVTMLRVHEFQKKAKVCKGVKGLDATAFTCLV